MAPARRPFCGPSWAAFGRGEDLSHGRGQPLPDFHRTVRPGWVWVSSPRAASPSPGLKERAGQRAGTLSGGEQQMLAVARGLMAEPEILMIDELSLGLAPVLVLALFESLLRLKADGLTMLLVEQNVRMALTVSDYAYVLAEGRVAFEGKASEVAENPEVKKAYLG